jgi:predicted secreted hydrolase
MFPTRLALCLSLLGVIACTPAAAPLPQVPLPSPTPAPSIVFPTDAGPHDSLTEWWYYTGHLTSAEGARYGFEFVIFQVERQNQPTGYLAHFALSDIDGQRFTHAAKFTERPRRATGFPLNVNGWTLDHTDAGDVITADQLSLTLTDAKPPALHDGGYITYGPAGGSYYYSRTRLSAAGRLDGAAVQGIAWMDHQWGNFVISASGGWDWYSLQLDDQTELMLYVLRSATGETTSVYGSHVLADGSVEDLAAGSVSAVATGQWTSPHTGATYPSGWQLTLWDGSRLSLEPQLQDQELYFPGFQGALAYWEGAVTVTGDHHGLGYVELTGYAN